MKTFPGLHRITMISFFLILYCCLGGTLPAQEIEMRFDHVLDLGALGTQTTLQDNDGFLWFGTESGGIFRYDGDELKNYGVGPTGLSNGTVWRILADRENPDIFWIGTNNGLNRFDKSTETFTYYTHNPSEPPSLGDNAVLDIVQDGRNSNLLWLGTVNGGLNKFDKETATFTRYEYDPQNPQSISWPEIWRMIEDNTEPNILWLGTFGGGLNKFEKDTETFTHYQYDPKNPTSFGAQDGIVEIITQDTDDPNILWIGINEGLERFDTTTETFQHYRHHPDKPLVLPKGAIGVVYDDGDGRLWLGGYVGNQGLTICDKEIETCTHYQHNAVSPMSLWDDNVMDVYKDRSGIFWIVTYSGKVDKIDPHTPPFRLYQSHAHPQSLPDSTVTSLYEDRNGVIWIGTQGGLSKFEKTTGIFRNYTYTPNDPESLAYDYILGFLEDESGNFWISVYLGPLVQFDRMTGKMVKQYQSEAESITKMIQDPQNPAILWLGTRVKGLAKFEKSTGIFTFYEPDPNAPHKGPSINYVTALIHDRTEDVIWFGDIIGGGLNKFDKHTETFTHYTHNPGILNSLSANAIAAIYQDAADILWIGTLGGGLNKFNPATETFTSYGREHGIPPEVNAILEDENKNLWLSTNHGIICFNPNTETIEHHYDKRDGLQGNVFLYGSALKTQDGQMWFGGTNGVNSFYPKQFTRNPYIPPVVLTSLTQGGESINWDHHKIPARLPKIILDWRKNFFEFEYAALNFTNPHKNQYKYMLEGFDRDWYNAGTTRSGRYSGLPGGRYTLRILGSNNDGIWNTEGVSLNIIVVPPFWQTWWFRTLFLVLAAGGIGGGLFLRISTINKQKRQLEIQVAERTRDLSARTAELAQSNEQLKAAKERAEVADQSKSTFLANMSHELRTPLNAVLGFAQLLTQSPYLVPDERKNVDIILRSGGHLLTLINQLLDLSKIEAGRMTLNEKNFDLYRLLDDVINMFRLRAEEKHLQFLFERTPDVPQYVCTDEAKLRQVLFNLFSNAFKFTDEGGVAVRVRCCDGEMGRWGDGEMGRWGDGETGRSGDREHFPPSPDLPISLSPRLPISPSPHLHFEIEDTGPGIAPDEMESLFEAFVQTTTGKYTQEGTGLGLPISRNFVQLMGGELKVKSEVGRGTLVTFDIHVKQVHATDVRTPQPTRRVIALAPDQPCYRILIVDDKQENRQLLLEILKPLGFDVREATNGQEALDIWDVWEPHLIWMDMRMPVMDGYEATEQIKANVKGQATAIIALTASAFDEEKAIVLSAGCNDFLRKPFKQAEIFDTLHKHLGVRYVYEEGEGQKAKGEGQKAEEVLTPEALATLPDEWLADLWQAIEAIDVDMIDSIIDRIHEHNEPLAEALVELVKNYRFDILQELFGEIEQ